MFLKWTDTTKPNDKSHEHWEFSSYQPWIEFSVGQAKYTINRTYWPTLNDDYWTATWWHGNRGHGVENCTHFPTKEAAQLACERHFERMAESIIKIIQNK